MKLKSSIFYNVYKCLISNLIPPNGVYLRLMLTIIFSLKELSKKSPRGPPKVKPKQNKNIEKTRNRTQSRHGTAVLDSTAAVHMRTAVRHQCTAVRQAHSWPCTGVPVSWPFCLGCTAVHPCGMPVRVPFSAVLLSWMFGASSNL